jgi:hypothetical protein
MMHTKALPGKHDVAPAVAGQATPRRALLPRIERWLMPWARLRARARDGGPPQWPLPWR